LVNQRIIFRAAPLIIIGFFAVILPFLTSLPIVSLVTKILIYALLVMSLDLVVGYAGLWSFCHPALFGVAAYTTAILITRYDIVSFWVTAPASVLMAMIVACIFGFIALRVSFVYFLLVTFALGQLVFGIVVRWRTMTGGATGISGIPYPNFGFAWYSPNGMYYFVLVTFILCSFVLYLITKSPFGMSLTGIRENEIRMRVLGYDTWLYKYIAFVVSALFAGVAGVLYVHYNGLIVPENVAVNASGLIWVMLIMGGTGTLWGGLLGSFVIFYLQYEVSLYTPDRWPLILGVCFIASVMFLRGGVFLHLSKLWKKIRQCYVKS